MLKCVGRLCEKVAMGWLQELLRSSQTNKLTNKGGTPSGDKVQCKGLLLNLVGSLEQENKFCSSANKI